MGLRKLAIYLAQVNVAYHMYSSHTSQASGTHMRYHKMDETFLLGHRSNTFSRHAKRTGPVISPISSPVEAHAHLFGI